jgi:hypothetical protein
MILIGAAVAIGAWGRLPSASPTDLHPSLLGSWSIGAPFVGGVICALLGIYIVLAAFFFPWWLPKTRHEREAESPEASSEQSSAAPSGSELDRPTVKYGDWEVTGGAAETTKDILDAFRSSGLVETTEGPRNIKKPKQKEDLRPTEASGS